MNTFVNILILLAWTVTMLSFIEENTYEPFTGFFDKVNQHYNENKRKARYNLYDLHSKFFDSAKRAIRKSGF